MAVWIPYLDINCDKCSSGQKAIYGCEEKTQIEGWWKVGDYELSRCPLKIVDFRIYRYISAYRKYEKGYLPNGVSWLDEPAKFIDIMDFIEKERDIVNSKMIKEKKK